MENVNDGFTVKNKIYPFWVNEEWEMKMEYIKGCWIVDFVKNGVVMRSDKFIMDDYGNLVYQFKRNYHNKHLDLCGQ